MGQEQNGYGRLDREPVAYPVRAIYWISYVVGPVQTGLARSKPMTRPVYRTVRSND